MQRDGVNGKKLVQVLAPAARTADANGDLDRGAYPPAGIVWFEVNMGAEGVTLSGTDKIEVRVRHGSSATPTTPCEATDVVIPQDAESVAGVFSTPAAANTGLILTFDANAEIPNAFRFGYVGSERYVNVLIDFSGTHGTATPCAVTACLEMLAFSPDA